ncbi:hypothetical protein [Tindallia californiensis]|uniref:DUF2680 domain-containing protein n=1 Tax=Tindallia californiensis TaxID=159292 RepID=A0A1H3PUH3_9FIRM|nr:hypothetical protein [Tindallia californiensis]SDZ04767.1 hypothetical protein SAMN05192546_107107 [Tindallia californiensis]
MKNVLKGAALSLLVVGLSASMVFADTSGRGNADGEQWKNLDATTEERLEMKIQRIDELVELERLTEEEALEFKEIVQERMEHCLGDASGREDHRSLGIGFGRTSERGHRQGDGHQHEGLRHHHRR